MIRHPSPRVLQASACSPVTIAQPGARGRSDPGRADAVAFASLSSQRRLGRSNGTTKARTVPPVERSDRDLRISDWQMIRSQHPIVQYICRRNSVKLGKDGNRPTCLVAHLFPTFERDILGHGPGGGSSTARARRRRRARGGADTCGRWSPGSARLPSGRSCCRCRSSAAAEGEVGVAGDPLHQAIGPSLGAKASGSSNQRRSRWMTHEA